MTEKVKKMLKPDEQKTEKSTFLRKNKKRYPEFLICFSLGNSTLLTKKLALGNIGHMDFWASTFFLTFSAILGVKIFEIPKFFLLKIIFGLLPNGGYNKSFLAGQPILTYSNS